MAGRRGRQGNSEGGGQTRWVVGGGVRGACLLSYDSACVQSLLQQGVESSKRSLREFNRPLPPSPGGEKWQGLFKLTPLPSRALP